MESQLLKQLVENNPQGEKQDLNSPFSFIEWRSRTPLISEKDILFYYNKYLLGWFSENKEKKISTKFALRQKYLYLLNQLQVYFTEEEKNSWYNNVNLADEKELLLAIPYFAKKLKDIALYYLKIRKSLKATKLRYNRVGTVAALEIELTNYFLENFIKENVEVIPTIQSQLPLQSNLKKSLNITIEELYDDTSYFDRSPSMPLSAYFDFSNEATKNFYSSKGIVLSSAESLFNALSIPLTANESSIIETLTGNFLELPSQETYNSFIKSTLGENKYLIEVEPKHEQIETSELQLEEGHNKFFYPFGLVDTSLSIPYKLKTVQLSSLQIEGATAGPTIKEADVIFVRHGNEFKSAWLYDRALVESSETIQAYIRARSTSTFIFPYPGFGLSAEDVSWTGSDFASTSEYEFLSKPFKNAVNEAYWNQDLSINSCKPLLLNNSTLLAETYPSNNPKFSDQIYCQARNENALSGAWCYKFEKTSIPVDPSRDNVILWPYQSVDSTSDIPQYIKDISFNGASIPVSINDIDKTAFIASNRFENADKIYKLNKYDDDIKNATECAWLSSTEIQVGNVKTSLQDGFNALFPAGESYRFVWLGKDKTPLGTVFKSFAHARGCPLRTSNSPLDWQSCTCKQVYYVPFGHNGSTFKENNAQADCIVEETNTDLTPFDFSSWLDGNKKSITSSPKFAWYQTSKKKGWGNGKWISSNRSTPLLTLDFGKTYIFRRSNDKLEADSFPPYSVKYSFNTSNTKWVRGQINNKGNWNIHETVPYANSEITFNAGDIIRYDRKPNTTFTIVSSEGFIQQSENRGSIWTSYDYIALDIDGKSPIGKAAQDVLSDVFVSWPILQEQLSSADPQYPDTTLLDLSAIKTWSIIYDQKPSLSALLTTKNNFSFTFRPTSLGTYTIAVTAIRKDGTELMFSNIPKITAANLFQERDISINFYLPSTGFLIEHPLRGWDYNTNKPSQGGNGARPYWAELYTDKNSNTLFKGIFSWGYPRRFVSGYLPNAAPILSPLVLSYGTTLTYDRKGPSFTWTQPITYQIYNSSPLWCKSTSVITDTSVLSSIFSSEQRPDLYTVPSMSPSDIELSNILNGKSVEIYYHALNSFVWNISTERIIEEKASEPELFFNVQSTYKNLPNRFFPTIAQLPVIEGIYSSKDVGGYFIPQNLGASQYINKDFIPIYTNKEGLSGQYIEGDLDVHIGGRGLSKQDQQTLYSWEEQNQWMKEAITTESFAGAPKKNLTKTLQTFIPYQNKSQTTNLGLVTPTSKFTPWGGLKQDVWLDKKNEPKGFTGVRNLSSWTKAQILKNSELVLDSYETDVYGNQYGLFKQPSNETRDEYGQLWTRTNDQIVFPASVSLSATFKSIADSNFDQTLFNDLIDNKIKFLRCYFDTILIETPTYITLVKIEFDYEKKNIESSTNLVKNIKVGNNLRFENTWFFAEEKKLILLFSNLLGNGKFSPCLYECDLTKLTLQEVYRQSQKNEFVAALVFPNKDITFNVLRRAAITYNEEIKKYLITYSGNTNDNRPFVINLVLNQLEDPINEKMDVYFDDENVRKEDCILPVLTFPKSSILKPKNVPFTFQAFADNFPTEWKVLTFSQNLSVDNTGTFNGMFDTPGNYYINIEMSNDCGTNRDVISLSIS